MNFIWQYMMHNIKMKNSTKCIVKKWLYAFFSRPNDIEKELDN